MPEDKKACPLTVWYIQGGPAPAYVFARSPIAAIRAYHETFPETEITTIELWLKIKERHPI